MSGRPAFRLLGGNRQDFVKPLIFEPLRLEQKERIDAITAPYGEGSCQHSFVTMYTLQEKYGDSVCIDGGVLYVRREKFCTDALSVCLMPLGDMEIAESVGRLLDDAHARHTRLRFFTATERAVQALQNAFPGRFICEENRDYAEYFYRADVLAEMAGPELAKKRGNLRRFYRSCPGELEIRSLGEAHFDELYAFLDRWLEQNIEDHDAHALLREKNSIEMQLRHFALFRLRGVAVYIGGQLRGFAYGTPLSDAVFDGLVMKGDRSVRQLGILLYREMARCCGCAYINAEEDVGVPGLRESKLSYYPVKLLKKFVVTEV
jgi:hypothetical protein